MIDSAPLGLQEQVTDLVLKVSGVITIKRIRIRPAGINIFVDITVILSNKLSFKKEHAICDRIENKIKVSIPEADITIHSEPQKKTN